MKRNFTSEYLCGPSSKLPVLAMEVLYGTKTKKWKVRGKYIILKVASDFRTYVRMRISINK